MVQGIPLSDPVKCPLSCLDLGLLKSEILIERVLISRKLLAYIACQNLPPAQGMVGRKEARFILAVREWGES